MKWTTFRFYYGTLTGHRAVDVMGTVWEILPINGRAGFEVRENDEFVGETFNTVEDAKMWTENIPIP